MTRIKICGLFREADIDAVNAAMPDYAGFVFAPSRRQVTPDQARALRRRLDPAIVPVGVFVQAPIESIIALFDAGIIAMVQLHGGEDAATIAALKQRANLPVIQAIRMPAVSPAPTDAAAAAGAAIAAIAAAAADYLLLDNGAGGTGQAFDWRRIPPLTRPYFLAGGIDETNIQAALERIPRPFAIDVSSGAETDGFKDPAKIMRLVQAVRTHTARSGL